jgi:hypothetical protein
MLTASSFQFSPLWGPGVTGVLAAGLLGALAWATVTLLRKGVRPGLVLALGVLRLGIILGFLLLIWQPALTYTRAVEQPPELLVLVDTSRSMGARGAGKGNRLEEVLSATRQGPLATGLRERFRLHWFAYDRTARPVEENELGKLKPAAASGHLAESLSAASDHARALGKRPARVLLLSDGSDRGPDDPAEVARSLGLPVDVLAPAAPPPAAPGPLQIADVQAARRILLGSETQFRLTLRADASTDRDRQTVLALAEDGKEVWRGPLALRAGRSEQTFSLAHRPTSAGLKQYEFRLSLPGKGAAVTEAPQRLSVQVVDSKYEVLILEDSWRWEYKFLHRLFEDDPSFCFTAFLARGGRTYVQFGSPDRRVNLIGAPQTRSDLEGFDTFFLGDVNPTRWPRGLADALAQLVTDEGRSLVVVAGPNLANLAAVPELHALLPVELTRESGRPVEGPIDVRLRPDASGSPFFFQLGPGEAGRLPALDRVYPAVRKRPGATVLLEAVKHRNPYGNLIVLAEHTVGRGRVLFVGTDTLWKWHTLATTKEGPTPYSIFWQQACRALSPLRSNVGAVNLWLTPRRTQAEVGQSVTIEAEIQSERPLPRPVLRASALLPDDRRVPLSFTADPSNPRRFRAELTPPLAGQLRVTGQVQSEGKTVAEATTAIQITEPGDTSTVRAADRAALERLATTTGGQMIDPARSETWPAAGTSLPAVPQLHTLDFVGNFSLMLLLCALLGIDWLIRLFKGLV